MRWTITREPLRNITYPNEISQILVGYPMNTRYDAARVLTRNGQSCEAAPWDVFRVASHAINDGGLLTAPWNVFRVASHAINDGELLPLPAERRVFSHIAIRWACPWNPYNIAWGISWHIPWARRRVPLDCPMWDNVRRPASRRRRSLWAITRELLQNIIFPCRVSQTVTGYPIRTRYDTARVE